MRYLISILILLVFTTSAFAEPDGYILIPKLGLMKSIHMIPDSDQSHASYYYDLDSLGYGVGYLQNTSWNNTDGGRTILVGHTPGAFEKIHTLNIQDEILLAMEGEYYTFTIFDKYVVHRSNDAVISTPAVNFEVVLITCTDDPDKRLILKAK